jgi:hypothetical protein
VGFVERLGSTLGRVEQVEDFAEGRGGGNFIRVRVQVDVTQPLCRGRKIWLGGEQDQWVSFKFERLPIFCYWCGHISHDDRDCPIWLNSRGQLKPETQEYGLWLRGDLPKFPRRDGPRVYSFPETRGTSTPAEKLEVEVQTKTNKETPTVTPFPLEIVSEKVDFKAQLKEIDRELGLEHGDINEQLEVLIQEDPHANFKCLRRES